MTDKDEALGPQAKKRRVEGNTFEVLEASEPINISGDEEGESSDMDSIADEYYSAVSPRGFTMLHEAAKNGDINSIRQLASDGANIEALNGLGETPLHIAIRYRFVEVIRELLLYGADPDVENHNGHTAIFLAADLGHHECIMAIVTLVGADVNCHQDYNGFTPLHQACLFGHVDVARTLISLGAIVDAEDFDSNTPFFIAARCGYLKLMHLLESKGANIFATNIDEKDALNYSSGGTKNRAAITRYFLKKGFEVNKKTETEHYTALHQAAYDDSVNSINALVANGANVEATDKRHNSTPLFHAVDGNSPNAIQCLIDRDANIFAATRDGSTAIHRAADIEDGREVDEEVIDVLIRNGLHVDQTVKMKGDTEYTYSESYFKTPIRLAAVNNRTKTIEMLLKYGASTREYGEDSPISYLALKGNIEALGTLLDNGIDILAPGNATIQLAAHSRELAAVDYLLANGVCVNHRDTVGHTALHYAAANGDDNIINHLLDRGADVLAVSHEKETPLHFAARNSNIDAINILSSIKGVNIEAQDENGFTPLHKAANYGEANSIRELHRLGASLTKEDKIGYTPLLSAARRGSAASVDILLHLGASVTDTTKGGETAIHLAIQRLQQRRLENLGWDFFRNGIPRNGGPPLETDLKPLVEKLISYHVPLDAQTFERKQTALHVWVMQAPSEAEHEFFESIGSILIDAGADLETANGDGLTPLLLAATERNLMAAKVLLKAKANVNALSAEGFTALHLSLRKAWSPEDCLNLVDELILHGANVKAKNNVGVTPLHLAAAADNHKAIKVLLRHGADPVAKTIIGHTPLHWAAEKARVAAVEVLIACGGFDPTVYNHYSESNPYCGRKIAGKMHRLLWLRLPVTDNESEPTMDSE